MIMRLLTTNFVPTLVGFRSMISDRSGLKMHQRKAILWVRTEAEEEILSALRLRGKKQEIQDGERFSERYGDNN
jgi:hypothetical protein